VKLKLTVRRSETDLVDLVATLDPAASVGDLATALHERDPRRTSGPSSGPVTLEAVGTRRVLLDPSLPVADSGIRSGAHVAVVRAEGTATESVPAAAVVRVLEGPDAGKEFRLRRGTSVVGRGAGCEVRLSDTAASRQHAKLHVSDVVEVVDLGSSNGVLVGGVATTRAQLRATDRLQLGDSVLTVESLVVPGDHSAAASVQFNRSPHLDPEPEQPEFVVPDPPAKPQPQRIPLIALLAPVLMGGLLFAITRQATSLIFIAMSPILLVGNAVESRVFGKKSYAKALAEWRAELADLGTQLRTVADAERVARLREHPSVDQARAAVADRSADLWLRRPERLRFLDIRLGVGTASSRTKLASPGARQCPKDVWNEIEQFAASWVNVQGVPVTATLTAGPLGIAGPRAVAEGMARATVLQLAAFHSPAEVVLGACLTSDTAAAWDWMKWLPHTSSAHAPTTGRLLPATPGGVTSLVAALEDLIEQRSENDVVPAVVLLVEDAAAVDRARLVTLAERGAPRGVHVVWLSGSREHLPAGCATFLDAIGGAEDGFVGRVTDGTSVRPVKLEPVDGTGMDVLARGLAPVVDSGALLEDASDLPRTSSWLTLHGGASASTSRSVLETWQESRSVMTGAYANPPTRRKPGSLRAVVGMAAGEPHVLDLRAQGPHALVGGTTGSGKSELLQSWILGLASAHSPQRVNFLLVDYKGGSAFRDCVSLPHTVGLVTDLSPHMVRRALTSLGAELKYREELLAHRRMKDLLELEEAGDPDTPPSLVIVVDEFAALVQEVPEFVDGVVNVAQRGRSLGLHLILATQRPAGVIKDNLRANTNLRLALRVADEADSTDVIGTTQAAAFDPGIPGRAVCKSGPGRLVPFQSAYAGGWTLDAPPPPEVLVEELRVGNPQVWEKPEAPESEAVRDLGPNDIARMVSAIKEAHAQAGLAHPRKPWLPVLADAYDLSQLPMTRQDNCLVFGVADDPDRQQQPSVAFYPDTDGNLAVFGTGGSGKSGLLRTLAAAAGFAFQGGPSRVYGLDFGARGLAMLEELPHVGSVIGGNDHERVSRLLAELRELIDERALRYARAGAGSITEYRAHASAPDEPRVLLLVDGIGAFRSAYETSDKARWFDVFQSIATDGRPVGVHVLLSADRPGAVPSTLGAAIQRRVVLRLADENDYSGVGEPADVLSSASPPGRGLLDGREIQVAILGGTRNTLEQGQAVAGLASSMNRAGVAKAPAVQRLAEEVALADLPASLDGMPVVGLGGRQLEPLSVVPSGPFVVTGPPGSGRTTALQTLVAASLRAIPGLCVHHFGPSRSVLRGMPGLQSSTSGIDEIARVAGELATVITDGPKDKHLVVIEGIADVANTPADYALQALAKVCLAADQWVIGEGEVTGWTSGSLASTLRAGRTGLSLQPDPYDGTSVFRTDFPRMKRAELPPGRGLLVRAGKTTLVQVAHVGGA
jgi:S-DNA-T family DNA segregation ATPase FtsK/SpoIIIE